MALIRFKVELFCFLFFVIQSSYADRIEDCNLQELKESVRKIDLVIDKLKFADDEDELTQAKVEVKGAICSILQSYSNIPEDCGDASELINEFVRDVKLIKQCSEDPSNDGIANLFESYKLKDTSYFKQKLSYAEGITPLAKQAEMFRALARLSFLSDLETNQKFYDQLKALHGTADSTASNILLEAMKTLISKAIKIYDDDDNAHPELLLDLYKYDKAAGKQTIEKIAIDVCALYDLQCFTLFDQIPDASLRAYANLAIWYLDTKTNSTTSEATTFIILPQLQRIKESKEFESLDADLKNEINKAHNEAPEEMKIILSEGEMCLPYLTGEFTTESKPNSIYLKTDSDSVTKEWKFVENTEGDIQVATPTHPLERQLYAPRKVEIPIFWRTNMTNGNWEMVPNGIDCDFNEKTYDVYICRNLGKYVSSPERSAKFLLAYHKEIEDVNSRRKTTCNV